MPKEETDVETPPSLVRKDGLCNIKNFAFTAGVTLPELRIQYSTLGTPHYDAEGKICNAVLLLHSSMGNRLHWLSKPLIDELFEKNQPLDAERYFMIVPDLIGHGQSSKPSDGLRARFPAYRCEDMLNALHLLVTRALRIDKLHLVMGTSLGGMLAWMWAQRFPEAANRVAPIGAYPVALGGRNWIIRRMIIEAIRNDPSWANGEYDKQPRHYLATAPLLLLMAHGVQRLQDLAPNQSAADHYYEKLVTLVGKHDANDLLYILESVENYDPLAGSGIITTPILAINFEGDELCRPDVENFEGVVRQLPTATSVLVPATRQCNGHLTYYQANTWKHHLSAFLDTDGKP